MLIIERGGQMSVNGSMASFEKEFLWRNLVLSERQGGGMAGAGLGSVAVGDTAACPPGMGILLVAVRSPAPHVALFQDRGCGLP